MTEEFTIQCQSCGTHYNDLQDVCPYCGRPQPEPTPEPPIALEEPAAMFSPAEYEPKAPWQEPGLEEPLYLTDEVLSEDYGDTKEPFAGDDIFAIAEEPETTAGIYPEYLDEYDDYPDEEEAYGALAVEPHLYPQPETFETFEAEPKRFRHLTLRRIFSGCLLLLVCLGLFYGALAILAVREGLEERTVITQSESQQHYERGQAHLAENAIELAIAEFERAVALNPNFLEARQALREAQRIAQSQPTPTSQTRSAAAADLLSQATSHLEKQNWAEAIEILLQVRDLDPDYQSVRVSELLYIAYYQLGLQKSTPNELAEALNLFEYALVEHPDGPQATAEKNKAMLYLEGDSVANNDNSRAVEIFSRLYRQQNNYLDVKQRLQQAYEALADEFLNDRDWCQAAAQYQAAIALQDTSTVRAKFDNSNNLCQGAETATGSSEATRTASSSSPNVPPQPTAPPITPTVSAEPATSGSGSIIYSAFNFNENRWEIVSIPAQGGAPKVLVTQATMPAISPNGQLLVYHAELVDSEGLHAFNLTTGEDIRVTRVKNHILPRWGGDNNQFIFVAQEGSTGRWLAHLGFADAKSDPLILRDGRTPDWSPDGKFIAYQGADPDGNNPGIYRVPFNGGEPMRLTNHESDRSPDFSPDGSQVAYMSTRNGNWDIYAVSAGGSAPRQITTAPGNDGLPVWSPDGRRLAYVSDVDGSWAIYVVNSAGGSPIKITEWDGAKHEDWLMTQIWWAK